MTDIEKPKTRIRDHLKNIGKESWALSGDLFEQMKYKGEIMAEKHKENVKKKQDQQNHP